MNIPGYIRRGTVCLLAARLLAAFMAPAVGGADEQSVRWLGSTRYLSGANVAWLNYGTDFGTAEEWGLNTYDHNAVEAMFAELQATGNNAVRWWLCYDGRAVPEFDSDSGGLVTGLDSTVLPNLEDAVLLAAKYDIYITFCLWDFWMLFEDGTMAERGEHAGAHHNLVTNSAARATFLTNALLPILEYPVSNTAYRVGTHPNAMALEVINEPEWGISESGDVDYRITQPVSLEDMREFVADTAGFIHRHANVLVTVGSAALKWNSNDALGAVSNWWNDAALEAYDPDGSLDFYEIHYYGWMNGNETTYSYSPMFNSRQDAGLDKPVVVGEFPALTAQLGWTPVQLLNGVYSNGYAGAWAWTYQGNDTNGDWSAVSNAYASFNAAHTNEIQPPAGHDEDQDGGSDFDEFIAGTDATVSGDVFRIFIAPSNGSPLVCFQGIEATGPGYGGVDRFYAIEKVDNLVTGVWRAVSNAVRIPAVNETIVREMTNPAVPTSRFFRAKAWLE